MANEDKAPSHEQVTHWLRQLMTKGVRDVRAEDIPELLSLHAIRILALVDLPSARLAALHQRLRELMRGVENERLRRLAPFAFGTYSVDPLPLETRLLHAASNGIGAQPRTLRKYLDQLASDMADKLIWLEERLRYNQWLDKPFDEALHDETLRQYDFLSAMAFWIEGARLDVEAALDSLDDDGEFRDFAGSALWRWTRYLRVAHRFDEAWQGRWEFRKDSKADLGEAIRSSWDVQAVPPLGPTERSFLRVELLASLQEELHPFIALLERREQGATVLRKWFEWLRSCHCVDDPDPNCTVHRFLSEASTLYENINLEVSEHHRTDRAARFQTLPDVYEP